MKDLRGLRPNELIRLAIKDMKASVEQGVTIDMRRWGEDVGTTNCAVCFAGSVMLQQGKEANEEGSFATLDLSTNDVNYQVYCALDYIRQGNLGGFCAELGIAMPLTLINGAHFCIDQFPVKYTLETSELFYAQMEAIANLWEA